MMRLYSVWLFQLFNYCLAFKLAEKGNIKKGNAFFIWELRLVF